MGRGRQVSLLAFLGLEGDASASPPQATEESPRTRQDSGRNPPPNPGRMLVEERIGDFTLAVEMPEAEEAPPSYLMASYYDGKAGKALLVLYNDEEGKLYFWHDRTGHKSYFLTDLRPEEVRRNKSIIRHPSFEGLETVVKYDLLRGEKVKLTKIVVKDPQAVAELRDKVPKAWEAKIKYHVNYIYDLQLIPGMRYEIRKGMITGKKPELDEEHAKRIEQLFSGEDDETKKLALEWAPLFEEPPPRMPRLAIDIEVYTPFRGRVPDPSTAAYPVISIALYSNDGYRRVLVLARNHEWGVPGDNYPLDADVEVFDDERAMLVEFFRVINKYPLILTFNGDNFDLHYIYNRALKLGVSRDEIPIHWVQDYATLKKGFHIDLYKFFQIRALQAYAFAGKYKQFTLDAIAEALLGIGKIVVEGNISDLTISDLVSYNFRDAKITLELTTFQGELVWKLIILLMRISKLGIEDVTRSQISNWIKNLFYWEHRRRGYLIPLKEDIMKLKGAVKSSATIKGKKYAGAVVLDPPEGVFFNIVVLDFASLYPSIIKTWNLSYETVNPEYCPGGKLEKIPEVEHSVCRSFPGITAQITGLLRDFRVKIYKKKAKDKSLPEEERSWYSVVEKAMKVFINASYGVFGADTFPLYAPPLAESVTALGRHVIRSTVKKAREMGLIVLYGDTDSLFLWSPDKERLEELRRWVYENFSLELDVDKIYRYVAFSGKKKNYLGVYPDGSIDVKGMLGKKRNTPPFLKQAFAEVLEELGSVETPENFAEVRSRVVEKLREVLRRLRRKGYTLNQLTFQVMLSKPLRGYNKNQPQHVKAALYLVKHGIHVEAGDIITYVKVIGRDGAKPIQLAKLPEIDVKKYEDHVKSTFEQVLSAIGISWDEIEGSRSLDLLGFT